MDSDGILETSVAKTSNWVRAEGKSIIRITFDEKRDFVLTPAESHGDSAESHGRPNSRVTERLSFSPPANSTRETPILHIGITSIEPLVPEAPETTRIVPDRGEFPIRSTLRKRASSV